MLKNIKTIFNKKNEFIISTHKIPDGDGLGSAYALYLALKQKKLKVKILTDKLDIALPFKIYNSKINKINKNTYLLIVDANHILKMPKAILDLKISAAKYIFIDHHNPRSVLKEALYYIKDDASSTGELIYTLLKKYLKIKFTKEIAKGIYTALIADTRSFKYSRTTALAHQIAYYFIKNKLINPEEIQNKLFDTKNPKYLKFIGHILSNFKINKEIAYIIIDTKILKKYNIKKNELKSSFNILFSVSNIICVILIYKKNSSTEFFIKSKKTLNYEMFSRFKPCIKKFSCTFKVSNHINNNDFIKMTKEILNK